MPPDIPPDGEIWDGGGRRYRMEKVVGNGAFGIVWRAREEGAGECVAIKKVVLDRRYHNRELEMMKGLDHEFVIKLHHSFEKPGRKRDETYLHLVMDFLPDTIRSVALSYQKNKVRFPIDHVRIFLYQTLKALEYVHGKRICHRDLKPDNLLVDASTLRLKLIDFGCAKVLVRGQPNVSYICSRYYRAPELMFGATEYTCAVDMWSIGTIMVELLLGHLPFQGQDSTQQHLVEIMKLLGTPSEKELRAMRATCSVDELPKLKAYPWERVFHSGTPQKAMDLAHKLLCYDPSARLTATQALAHPFLEGVEGLLGGNHSSAAFVSESAKLWKSTVKQLFSAAQTARDEKLYGTAIPQFCDKLLQESQSPPHDLRPLAEVVREADDRARSQILAGLRNALTAADGGGEAGNGAASGGGGNAKLEKELREHIASMEEESGMTAEKMRAMIEEESREVERLKAEVESLKQGGGRAAQPSAAQATAASQNAPRQSFLNDGENGEGKPSQGRRGTALPAVGGEEELGGAPADS